MIDELDLSKFEGHTPGPWETGDGLASHGVIRGGVIREYNRGSGRDQIVMVCSLASDNGGHEGFAANTALIAAAPALLAEVKRNRDRIEALEKALRELVDAVDFLADEANMSMADDEIARARAALQGKGG